MIVSEDLSISDRQLRPGRSVRRTRGESATLVANVPLAERLDL